MIKEFVATAVGLAALIAVNHISSEQDAPAMWVAEDADTRVYLFGTFHMVPGDLDWRTQRFEAAMLRADVTYLEADGQTPEGQGQIQAFIGQNGLNPEGITLSEQLGYERAAAFSALAERFGLPMNQLERLRPWLAVVAVTQQVYSQLGMNATPVDTVIYRQAESEGDDLRFLETPAAQLSALATLGGEEMLSHVDQGIATIEELEQYTDDLLVAWTAGDENALKALVVARMEAETPGLFQAIFVERNAAWTAQISELMDGEGDYMIAVGAGHLVGDQSVIAMLRAGGITVTRIQ